MSFSHNVMIDAGKPLEYKINGRPSPAACEVANSRIITFVHSIVPLSSNTIHPPPEPCPSIILLLLCSVTHYKLQ